MFISIFSSQTVFALKIKPLNLLQLATQSETIALIKINASKIIKSGDIFCGIEHKAHVIKFFKGKTTDEFNFGYMQGLKTGRQYLVFLNSNNIDSKSTIFTGTNLQKQYADKTTLAECRKHQLAEYTLAQAGLASFEIEPAEAFDFKAGVKIQTQYFRIPDDIRSDEDKQSPEVNWVKLDELLQLLNLRKR